MLSLLGNLCRYSNISSALFGGIPATGAIARTAANVKNGGRTPIAGMVHAVTLLIILLVLMPYAALIPMPAIAAVLFIVAYNMSGWRKFLRLVKTAPKSDTAVLLATFLLTVIFDLVIAIEVGMLSACILFMKRMSDETNAYGWKEIDENTDDENIRLKKVPENTMVFEITGPIFFGASTKITDVIRTANKQVIILRMRSVPAIDATGLHSLETIVKLCEKQDKTLIFSHVNEQPMKTLEKAGILDKIMLADNIDMALEKAEKC